MNPRQLLQANREDILRIAAEHGAHNVRMFGLAAKGWGNDESDIELLVDLEPGVSLLQHAKLTIAIEDLLGRKVSVMTKNALKERYREKILADAVPI